MRNFNRKHIAVLIIFTFLLYFTVLKGNKTVIKFVEKYKLNSTIDLFNDIRGYMMEKKEVVEDFEENKKIFNSIASYITNYEKDKGNTFFIEKINESYSVKLSSVNGQKKISSLNKKLSDDIESLFLLYKYRNIDEDGGNGIYFTLKDTSFKFEHGVVFSKDGKEPDG